MTQPSGSGRTDRFSIAAASRSFTPAGARRLLHSLLRSTSRPARRACDARSTALQFRQLAYDLVTGVGASIGVMRIIRRSPSMPLMCCRHRPLTCRPRGDSGAFGPALWCCLTPSISRRALVFFPVPRPASFHAQTCAKSAFPIATRHPRSQPYVDGCPRGAGRRALSLLRSSCDTSHVFLAGGLQAGARQRLLTSTPPAPV